MSRRPRGARGAALALALAAPPALAEPAAKPPAPPAAAAQPPDAAYATSDEGHRFRVGFDPASRIWLGLAGAMVRGTSGAPAGGFELDAGVGYRVWSASGEGKDRVSWQVDHRVAAGWVRPVPRAGGVPALDAALYGVSMLRHDASPSLVLPTSPPVGIPFPFDAGLEAEVGRVTTLAYPAPSPVVRVGAARAGVLLDPWRSGAKGRSVELGVGARYDVDVSTAGGAQGPAVVHRIAPMTAGSVRFRFQSPDGLSVVDCRSDVVPHLTSEGGWKLYALSSVHLERALVAVADQPVAAVLEGGYRFDPPRHDAEAASDFRVSLGLTMNLSLR